MREGKRRRRRVRWHCEEILGKLDLTNLKFVSSFFLILNWMKRGREEEFDEFEELD